MKPLFVTNLSRRWRHYCG